MDSVHAQDATRTTFDLVLLGQPVLRDALGQTPIGLGLGKPLALLCFLCVGGEARRDEALALLWGDVAEGRARNAFRQALHRLRLALGDDLVIGDRQTLKIALGDRLRADVREFEKAIDDSRFDEAITLYRGEFLDGFDVGSRAFDQWVEGERARLRSRCQSAAERAVQRALVEGRLDAAESAIRKLLAVAPLDARAIEIAAMSFVSMGRRAEAAEVLQRFERRAEAELGAKLPDHLKAMLGRVDQRARVVNGLAPVEADFVERDGELARLLALWNALDENTGATVIIEGVDGVRKSRLVRAFADGVAALGAAHVLRGVEGPTGHTAPYAAISAALRPIVRAPGVAGASPHLLAEAARLLPELRDCFQLPQVELVQEDAARLRISEGVAALLEAAAYERPICLIIEDADRASALTLELIGYLAGRLRRAPVLMALTFNPEGASPDVVSRLRALDAHRIALEPLASRLPPTGSRLAVTFVRYFPHWRFLAGAAVATTVIAIAASALAPRGARAAFASTDTLVVAKADELRSGRVHFLTSDPTRGLILSEAHARLASTPAWADSVTLPWVNAIASPSERFVGLERITPQGSNVYLVSADRRDTVPLVVGAEEALGMGWSPDGNSFLVTRRSHSDDDGQSHAALFAFSTSRARPPVPIDTLSDHSVVEAAWSPDGSRIAWVARIAGGNEEVFVAWADGTNRQNVSDHSAQDDHLAWSPDGSLVAFTSRRDGNAEIYAYDLLNARLWRLTDNRAHDDRAAFAGDGRSVAFESTRDGAPDVYLMPTLGGDSRHVGDSTSRYGVVGWRGSNTRYIDRLDIEMPESARTGDTVVLRLRALDQHGVRLTLDHSRWTVLDSARMRELSGGAAESASERRFVALSDGLGRVAVTVGGWRADTAHVKLGDGTVSLLRDAFDGSSMRNWHVLGRPGPTTGRPASGTSGLSLNADREWESGILSRTTVPLRSGLSVNVILRAPFRLHAAATSASVSLVAPETLESIDPEAPRFLRLISLTWNADAGRFIYAAEREVFAEPVPAGSDEGTRAIEILVNADGTVSFLVDGAVRWRSTVRVLRSDRFTRAHLWLGGQDTGARVGFGNVNVSLGGASR